MQTVNENVIPLVAFFIFMLVFTLFAKWYIKRAEWSMLIDAVPGVKSYPIIGTTHMFFGVRREDFFEVLRKEVQQNPYISRMWLGSLPEVTIRKAEYVEKVIGGSKNLEKSPGYEFLKPWLGEGLLLSKGAKWHKHRKIITPTFHYGILESFCDIFSEKSKIFIDKLDVHCGTGEPFDIYKYITRVTLDIVCVAAMGTKVDAQENIDNEYVGSIYSISELIMRRLLRLWLHPNFIYKWSSDYRRFDDCLKKLHGYTRDVIEKRKAARTGNIHNFKKNNRLVFLDLLLEEHEASDGNITIQDICDEVDTFMFEGHDTTTAALSWTLFLIGSHPHVQEKIFEEMDTIFEGSDRPATLSDLNEMKYLERCIKEGLRLYPAVPKVGRMLNEDVQLDEYKIPKGCMIGIHIFFLHRDERFFPDPEKFDPDRFLPENTIGRHPFAYIPFSAGNRNCIGQKFAMNEEKSVLSSIFRNYRVTSVDSRENVKIVSELILRPLNGISVTIEKRRKSH
ncbi:cytochrome P450 4C1-like [Bradysia coprophila]|uniref:cytochrome P450 4C1-like n=1 Tax=Bradysia coprophila TaxID=38358 RepID=UPI00187D7382|nr:cytochrome P450 4C1-like [Bradysia coprophila]XP_037040612.1 cytochrome P450 4C1-like [Bradysia coprophila]